MLIPKIVTELLEKVGEDFVMLIIGDGYLMFELGRMIRELELDDYVRLLGPKTNTSEYLAASDIFLLPSVSEGISIAVAEAMAMGLPVVTARAGALPEQLGDGTTTVGGILVDHTLIDDEDAPLYASAVGSLVGDSAARRRLGQNARKLVETGRDWRMSLQGLFREAKLAKNLEGHAGDGRYPHPAGEFLFAALSFSRILTDPAFSR
jgi:glycosyltransferase involved in cell wall biosynthesis